MQRGSAWGHAISESVGACTNPMDSSKRLGHRVMAVQDQRYKLLINFERGDELLFDLETDPAEIRPVGLETGKEARGRLWRSALKHLDGQGNQCSRHALEARIRDIRLEWRHSKRNSEALVS